MTAITIEAFEDVGTWRARRANGSDSDQMSILLDGPPRLAPPSARPTGRIVASADADTHRVERTGAAVDFTDIDDLAMWVRGEQRADGTVEHPFFAEVRLGSTALAPDANANGWRRFVPIVNPRAWEYVPLSLSDLAPQVRSAVSTVWITSLLPTPWTLGIDTILGVRDQILVDVDAALRALLHQQVHVGGGALSAAMAPTAAPPAEPYLRITHNSMRPLLAEATSVPTRTDYAGTGFALRLPSMPVELTYAIEVVSAERTIAAEASCTVLQLLLDNGVLVVNGRPCRLELLDPGTPGFDTSSVGAGLPEPTNLPVPPLFSVPPAYVRIVGSVPRRSQPRVATPPFNAVAVGVDQHAAS